MKDLLKISERIDENSVSKTRKKSKREEDYM